MAPEEVASTKQEAKDRGLSMYRGAPCRRAGHTVRYLRGRGCVQCRKDRFQRNKEAKKKKAPPAKQPTTDTTSAEDVGIPAEKIAETKQQAEERGLTFFRGSPCRRAGHRIRYASNDVCAVCAKLDRQKKASKKKTKASSTSTATPAAEEIADSKAEAKEKGLKFYRGNPCQRAGHTLRYSHGACVACSRKRSRERHQRVSDPDYEAPQRTGPWTEPLTDEERTAISAMFSYSIRTHFREKVGLRYMGYFPGEIEALRAVDGLEPLTAAAETDEDEDFLRLGEYGYYEPSEVHRYSHRLRRIDAALREHPDLGVPYQPAVKAWKEQVSRMIRLNSDNWRVRQAAKRRAEQRHEAFKERMKASA